MSYTPTIRTADILDDAVTFGKTQNIATNRLLGRSTAGSGDIEEITVGSGLSLAGGSLSATGGMGGSGTAGKIAKFTAATTLGDSVITESGASIGINTSPSAGLHVIKTTEQLRLGYDASNYLKAEVNAAGDAYFTTTAGGQFRFVSGVATLAEFFPATISLQKNTLIAATLNVTGAVDFDDTLIVGGNAQFSANLGIGTAPSYPLHVVGVITGTTYINAGIGFQIGGLAPSGEFLRGNGTGYVSNTIQAGDIPSSVDAAKIANGSVSNTEFQYLDGVTSAIQTQINGKVGGSGSSGKIAKFTASATLGDSIITEAGSKIGINTAGPDRMLDVLDTAAAQLRLTYTDGSVYTDFRTLSSGIMEVVPTSGTFRVTAPAATHASLEFYADKTHNNSLLFGNLTDGPDFLFYRPANTRNMAIFAYAGGADLMYWDGTNRRISFGTINTAPNACVEIRSTIEQLRLLYDASNVVQFTVSSAGHLTIDATGASAGFTFSDNVGVGITPTAKLHMAAGTATASTAPLKFTSGTNLTTPEDGAVEYDGALYYKTVGTTRYRSPLVLAAYKAADESVTSSASMQADDHLTVTVPASTKFRVEIHMFFEAGTTGGIRFDVDGTATTTNVALQSEIFSIVTGGFTGGTRWTALNGGGNVANGDATGYMVRITGAIEFNAAGTFYVKWAQRTSNGTATVNKRGGYMALRKI